jgi:hypothetical protein
MLTLNQKKHVLDQVLLAMLGTPELVERWWHGANRGFDDETPDAVWQRDPQQVISYVMYHASK